MLKAITISVERAEEVLAAVRDLVELSTQQLEMCNRVLEELAFSGELQKDFMKRLVRTQSDVRKARVRLRDMTSADQPAPRGNR